MHFWAPTQNFYKPLPLVMCGLWLIVYFAIASKYFWLNYDSIACIISITKYGLWPNHDSVTCISLLGWATKTSRVKNKKLPIPEKPTKTSKEL